MHYTPITAPINTSSGYPRSLQFLANFSPLRSKGEIATIVIIKYDHANYLTCSMALSHP